MTHPTDPQFVLVPREPTEEMWSGLARDLVFWQRQHPHTGTALYKGLRMIGRQIPEWLLKEIPDADQVPSKGTVAACIYKAQLAAAPAPPAQGEDIATLRARLAQAEELAMAAKFTEEVINRWRETGLPSVPKFMVAQDKLRAALTAWNTGKENRNG